MDLFILFLSLSLIFWGVGEVIGNGLLVTLGAIAGIVAGVIGLFRLF